ncbi:MULTISPECIES: hypothetical protein [Bacillus]|jgi:uncharacterized membrane protein YiaA|uniref:DUF3995 domain-containing protein n=1 Tax=Bacillus mycoides TaxID=1405 RepID=A0A3D9UTF4_BACMY|nr:hypothetical protein [Bacillus sp. DB-2]RBP25097.1 hypothetical protein DET63_11136 [Bacillus sp. DB-2]REF32748.1 hypothetical protein DET55_117106 [Bacillus mycoides]
MKNIGTTYVLSGVLLFGLTYITSAIYAGSLEIWDRLSGKFFTAFYEIHGTTLSIISICLIIVGIYCIHKKV